MIRFNLANVIDLLTDSVRCIVLVLVLLWLVAMAAGVGV